MTKDAGKIRLRWKMKQVSSPNTHVLARPGLYAIGHDETYYGLERRREYVYIGRSNNLRRRLTEHLPREEQNPGLRKYLRANIKHAKCWWVAMDESEIERVEMQLIDEFQPLYNRQGKRRDK